MYDTGQSSDTLWIDTPCAGRGCRISEMDHFDEPGTGLLWCHTHGATVGQIVAADGS